MLSDDTRSLLNAGVDPQRLSDKYAELKTHAQRSIGYPCNQDFDYSDLLSFLSLPVNNVGDPFQSSSYNLNTLEFEREVIDIFAGFAALPKEDRWGYVTSGGTEGNMYGMYLARELYPQGMVYFSEHTHYSVAKILRLQHTPSIMIKAQENGEMDYDDLRESIRINRHRPPIIFANIGTTMTGAIDDITTIKDIFQELAIRETYIHADAALHGLALAFIDNPPPWNFSHSIDSLSISGHKWLGSPLPCGIALARAKHVERISRAVEYVGVNDTTITGSRSGIAPLMLWHGLLKHGESGLRQKVKHSIQLARYTITQMQQQGINAWRNQNSPIVVFPRPSHEFASRWSLALDGEISHIVCLPYMDEQLIDEFISEYCTDQAKD